MGQKQNKQKKNITSLFIIHGMFKKNVVVVTFLNVTPCFRMFRETFKSNIP